MLLEIKNTEKNSGISKRNLVEAIGVYQNSIQTWRTFYLKGGINALINYTTCFHLWDTLKIFLNNMIHFRLFVIHS